MNLLKYIPDAKVGKTDMSIFSSSDFPILPKFSFIQLVGKI